MEISHETSLLRACLHAGGSRGTGPSGLACRLCRRIRGCRRWRFSRHPGEQEIAFIAARDSFYLASVSETGWPYVQHRGGPTGFVRRVDERTIGWADYVGNRQYVSAGNTAVNDRVAMIFMDYPHQERLKVLGHMRSHDTGDRLDLASRLGIEHYRARVERFVLVTVKHSTGTVRNTSRRASRSPRSNS